MPTGLTVAAGNSGTPMFWDIPRNAGGEELATAYKVYWGANSNGSSNTAFINAPAAQEEGLAAQTGLVNGSVYYYQVTALVGATESARSVVVGPITIGAIGGGNTVSGSVTFTGSATGPMLVGVYSDTTGGIYLTTIASPVSPQSYTVTGVPSGSYGNFAVIDMNTNNLIDQGDISNTNGTAPTITVSGATTANITLSSASSFAKVNTSHFRLGGTGTSSYSLAPEVVDGMKRVTKVTLASGKHIAVPHDLGKSDSEFEAYENINANVPLVGDAYTFKVFYSDGTNETVVRNVSAVLTTHALSLATSTTTGGGSVGAPLFTWAAPSPLPGFAYTYRVYLSGGTTFWNYPQDGDIPSTGPLQILYNADSRATPAILTTGTYNWNISVRDAEGNSAESGATYMVP